VVDAGDREFGNAVGAGERTRSGRAEVGGSTVPV
jgi:hypothetical protein